MMNILALSGSLRAQSSNTALLNAAKGVSPAGVRFSLYDGIGVLPHFNADLEEEGGALPRQVAEFRSQVKVADALVMSIPEYARGIPGSFKNALDWLVGSPSFPGTPVALFNASARGVHAQAALRLTLVTMSARLIDAAELTLPLLGAGMSAAAIAEVHGEELTRALQTLILALSDLTDAR